MKPILAQEKSKYERFFHSCKLNANAVTNTN